MVFICPICKKKLENTVHAYCCENGHSYDVSAQGYVHLLPPNKMHSKIPGDNRVTQRIFGNRSLPSVQ